MSKLFEPSPSYRPFVYPWGVEAADEHERVHWIQDEAPMADDVSDWKMGRLTDYEKEFVTQILRMFTQADANVGSYYYDNLLPVMRNNEIRQMLGAFAAREGIHQRAYALLNDTLGLPEGDFAAFLTYKEMADKHEHMQTANTSTTSGIALALAKGVFNEGVSLFGSFAMLLNFQRRGLMKGMGKIVEWSVRDESAHVVGLSRLFRTVCADHPRIVNDAFKKSIYKLARETVRLEDAFIDLAYKVSDIEGLTANEIKTYIRYITDRRLVQMGLKENFMIDHNPIPWLDWIINSTRHTNFFEGKVTEYEVAGLQGEWVYPSDENKVYRVYTKPDCPWCDAAKKLLQNNLQDFEVVELLDIGERQWFFDERDIHPEARTWPKVYEIRDGKEHLIGGFTDLKLALNP